MFTEVADFSPGVAVHHRQVSHRAAVHAVGRSGSDHDSMPLPV